MDAAANLYLSMPIAVTLLYIFGIIDKSDTCTKGLVFVESLPKQILSTQEVLQPQYVNDNL